MGGFGQFLEFFEHFREVQHLAEKSENFFWRFARPFLKTILGRIVMCSAPAFLAYMIRSWTEEIRQPNPLPEKLHVLADQMGIYLLILGVLFFLLLVAAQSVIKKEEEIRGLVLGKQVSLLNDMLTSISQSNAVIKEEKLEKTLEELELQINNSTSDLVFISPNALSLQIAKVFSGLHSQVQTAKHNRRGKFNALPDQSFDDLTQRLECMKTWGPRIVIALQNKTNSTVTFVVPNMDKKGASEFFKNRNEIDIFQKDTLIELTIKCYKEVRGMARKSKLRSRFRVVGIKHIPRYRLLLSTDTCFFQEVYPEEHPGFLGPTFRLEKTRSPGIFKAIEGFVDQWLELCHPLPAKF